MKHPNNTITTVDTGFRNWSTPIPYLFGGLALMLGLIAVALIILACSYRKSSSNSASGAAPRNHHRQQQKPAAKQVDQVAADGSEPNIVVILAGQTNPTHLANPISS